jgi:hypothetical protein
MKFKSLFFAAVFGAFFMNSCQQGESVAEETNLEETTSEVTDDDLKLFAYVVSGLQEINQSLQGEMIALVEGSGMSVETFSEMQFAMQNPESAGQFSEEEQMKFAMLVNELEKIQVEGEQLMLDLLSENGMSESRYQEIAEALQADPEKMTKFMMFQEELN